MPLTDLDRPPCEKGSGCVGLSTQSSLICFSLQHHTTLERQNSLPDVKDLQESATPSAHHHSKTQSLPRSNSGLSVEGQLSSTASGYAATGGSGSSLDVKSCDTPNIVNHELEAQKLKAQYSYPLQKLLAQPYDPETDDFDLLDPPFEPIHTRSYQGDCRHLSDDLVSHTPSYPHTHTRSHPPLYPHSADSSYSENHHIESRLGSSRNVYSSNGSSSAIRLSANVPAHLRSPADLYTEHSHGNITIEV